MYETVARLGDKQDISSSWISCMMVDRQDLSWAWLSCMYDQKARLRDENHLFVM